MNASELLDQLSEFQAQRDYLALKKQELLDEVKIPAEVLAAQDEANKQRQKIDSEMWAHQKEIQETTKALLAEVIDPPMPPEFVAALAAARQEREDIQSQAASRMEREQKAAAEAKAKIDTALQAKVSDVYKQVEARKLDITAEFSGKEAALDENIETMTKRVKDAVEQCGESVKGQFLHAVYVKGRVTWNTDMLDGMIVAFPALEKARKVGKPSVTIRRI